MAPPPGSAQRIRSHGRLRNKEAAAIGKRGWTILRGEPEPRPRTVATELAPRSFFLSLAFCASFSHHSMNSPKSTSPPASTWGSAALSLQKHRCQICWRIWYKVDERWGKATTRPSPASTAAMISSIWYLGAKQHELPHMSCTHGHAPCYGPAGPCLLNLELCCYYETHCSAVAVLHNTLSITDHAMVI